MRLALTIALTLSAACFTLLGLALLGHLRDWFAVDCCHRDDSLREVNVDARRNVRVAVWVCFGVAGVAVVGLWEVL